MPVFRLEKSSFYKVFNGDLVLSVTSPMFPDDLTCFSQKNVSSALYELNSLGNRKCLNGAIVLRCVLSTTQYYYCHVIRRSASTRCSTCEFVYVTMGNKACQGIA